MFCLVKGVMSTVAEDNLEPAPASEPSYYERNKEKILQYNKLSRQRPEAKERRRELYHSTRAAMVAQGLVEKRGQGRPRIYATKEDAAVARRAKAVGVRERWRALRAQLAQPPARSDGE
jgi:hypothetical protein